MENATKALLVAAAILITVMILSALIVIYDEVSSYYNTLHEEKEIQQLADFNEVFENYHRNNIRGTDLISLMNRIIDYNERLSYEVNTQYPRIQVTISIGNNIEDFKYDEDIRETIFRDGNLQLVNGSGEITNTAGVGRIDDNRLIAITGVENEIIDDYSGYNLTPTKLQRLSSDISNIIIDEEMTHYPTEIDYDNAIKKREDLLKNILKKDNITRQDIDNAQEIAGKYYEFTQFKRAMFNCTQVNYDVDTGRIREMIFEVQIENNVIVFN